MKSLSRLAFRAAIGFCALAAGPAGATVIAIVTLAQNGTGVDFDVSLSPGFRFVETAAGGGELFLFNDSLSGSAITNISATLNGASVSITGGLSGFTNLSPVATASDGTFTASVECTLASSCAGLSTPNINDLSFTVTNATLAELAVTNSAGNFSSVDVVGPTPLPATLPLFATGLGGLGLLGWRRKRKAVA